MLRFFILISVVVLSSIGVAGNNRFADQDVTHMTVPEYRKPRLRVKKVGFFDEVGKALGQGVETLGRAAGDIVSFGQAGRDRDAAHQREVEAAARHQKEMAEAREAAKKREMAAVLKTQEQILLDLGEIAKSIAEIKSFNNGIYKLAEAELATRNSLRSYVRGAMDYLKGANADYKDIISGLIAQQSQPVDATQAILHQKEIVNSIRRTAKFQGQKVREFLQYALRATSSESISQLMQLVTQSLTSITALETEVNVKIEGYRANVSELKFQLNGPSVPQPVQPIQAASEESNQPAQSAI